MLGSGFGLGLVGFRFRFRFRFRFGFRFGFGFGVGKDESEHLLAASIWLELQGRYGGDIGEIRGRYRGDRASTSLPRASGSSSTMRPATYGILRLYYGAP